MKELHKFWGPRPTMREVFKAWNAAKEAGDIPRHHTFANRGSVEQVWGGWILVHL